MHVQLSFNLPVSFSYHILILLLLPVLSGESNFWIRIIKNKSIYITPFLTLIDKHWSQKNETACSILEMSGIEF
jgi:hypothetical protein